MKNGIVTIKAWKRPYYLKQILDNIKTSYNYDNYDYYISIDYHPKTNKESLQLITEFIDTTNDIDVKYDISNISLGCAGNHKICHEYAFIKHNYDYMIHFEDDTLPGKDVFLWYEWAREKFKNDDELFAITPFMTNTGRQQRSNTDLTTSFIYSGFECQGGFLMFRKIHNLIYKYGGVFGSHGYNKANSIPPEEFKDNTTSIVLSGSWATPFNHYFRRIEGLKYCLCPEVSRVNNIGDTDGVWNPSKEWHNKIVLNHNWILSDRYKDVDFSNITYNDYIEDVTREGV